MAREHDSCTSLLPPLKVFLFALFLSQRAGEIADRISTTYYFPILAFTISTKGVWSHERLHYIAAALQRA